MKKGFSYFPTTPLDKGEHHKRIKNAATQETLVRDFFRQNPERKFTRLEVYDNLLRLNIISTTTPESSIGRAMSTLKAKGVLEKTQIFKKGRYGATCHLYKLAES